MARKPFRQMKWCLLRTLFLLGMTISFSGCEVGRTMFQYTSGSSSPWVGIDLLPRKAKTTKISHKQIAEVSSESTSEEHQLISEQSPVMSKFRNKSVRLNLPASQPDSQNNPLKIVIPKTGTVPAATSFDF